MRVIVTRPVKDCGKWMDAFTAAGYEAVSLPLMEVSGPPDGNAVVGAWNRIAQFDAVMFVSGNAVEHFFALKPPLSRVLTALDASKVRAYVTGPGTAAALQSAHVPLHRIDMPRADAERFDSEALWEVVKSQVASGFRVLIVRGSVHGVIEHEKGSGRDWFALQVEQAGGAVDFVVAYQRGSPVWGADQRQLAQVGASDGSVWIFSSSEAVAHLIALCPGQDWQQAKAVVTHPRIGRAANAAGFGTVVESNSPADVLLSSIESLR
jgi:uroporphyrinogen-III synthase